MKERIRLKGLFDTVREYVDVIDYSDLSRVASLRHDRDYEAQLPEDYLDALVYSLNYTNNHYVAYVKKLEQ